VRRPLPVDDPRRRRPDISKARRLLGWEPKVPLEEGLPQAIRWFREAYI
jgi:UDP-glucuronate decarboxylase